MDSGEMGKLKVAVEGERGGFRIQRPIVDGMVEALKARRIDYLDVDPFVSCHAVDENNNGAIDAVSKEWVQVAHRANCAVSLAHHVRKAILKKRIDTWLASGALRTVMLKDRNHEEREHVEVGQWAIVD